MELSLTTICPGTVFSSKVTLFAIPVRKLNRLQRTATIYRRHLPALYVSPCEGDAIEDNNRPPYRKAIILQVVIRYLSAGYHEPQ